MTYQRWGATKFVRGQMRIACDNKYDENAEPAAGMLPGQNTEDVDMAIIYDLIKPACPKLGRSDTDAILKRATFVINSGDYIYIKIAGNAQPYCLRNDQSFLTEEACRRYQAFRDSSTMPAPADLREEIGIEQRCLDRLFDPAPRRWRAGVACAPPAMMG